MKIMQIINAKGLPGIKGPSNGEAKKINADGIREEADGNHVRFFRHRGHAPQNVPQEWLVKDMWYRYPLFSFIIFSQA